MKVYNDLYEQIISPENLLKAWGEFVKGKRTRPDVLEFEQNLEAYIFALHRELASASYKHGPYSAFYIQDPKQRLIHKATVRDRVLHHAVFSALNPIFEPTFIANSFSCRVGKGTHRGVQTLAKMLRQVSTNNTAACYALKCDISKFFATVDQETLLSILKTRIKDKPTIDLLANIIDSFGGAEARHRQSFNSFDITDYELSKARPRQGLPIGNLTSQLFANVYMNEFDQFVKHWLKVKNYVRYTDDFIVVSDSSDYLMHLLPQIEQFLERELSLKLHPNKISIRKYGSGVDFLGYVILPHHIRLRTKTKRRIERKLSFRTKQFASGTIKAENLNQSWQSYLSVLSHANSHKLTNQLVNIANSEAWE